jgi:uncharacterized membrane protein YecN with MAPEG domain
MLIVTSIFASLLTIIYIRLAFNVISLRRKNKIPLGNGGFSDLEKAIRTHGNFSEYVPIALILMGCLELNGAPWWLVTLYGITLSMGRLFHAIGIKQEPESFENRIRGMKFTFSTLIALIATNLGWVVFKLI